MYSRFVSYFFANRNRDQFDVEAQVCQEEKQSLINRVDALSEEKPATTFLAPVKQEDILQQKLIICHKLMLKMRKLVEGEVLRHNALPIASGMTGVALPILGGVIYGLNRYFISHPLNGIIKANFWPKLNALVLEFYAYPTSYCATISQMAHCGSIFPKFITNFFDPDDGSYPNPHCNEAGYTIPKIMLNTLNDFYECSSEEINDIINICTSRMDSICEIYLPSPISYYSNVTFSENMVLGFTAATSFLALAIAVYAHNNCNKGNTQIRTNQLSISAEEAAEMQSLIELSGLSGIEVNGVFTPNNNLVILDAPLLSLILENHIALLKTDLKTCHDRKKYQEKRRISFLAALNPNIPETPSLFSEYFPLSSDRQTRANQDVLHKIMIHADLIDEDKPVRSATFRM